MSTAFAREYGYTPEPPIQDTGKSNFYASQNLPGKPENFQKFLEVMHASPDHAAYIEDLQQHQKTLEANESTGEEQLSLEKRGLLKDFKDWKDSNPDILVTRGYISKESSDLLRKLNSMGESLDSDQAQKREELNHQYQEKLWLAFLDQQEIQQLYKKRQTGEKENRFNLSNW